MFNILVELGVPYTRNNYGPMVEYEVKKSFCRRPIVVPLLSSMPPVVREGLVQRTNNLQNARPSIESSKVCRITPHRDDEMQRTKQTLANVVYTKRQRRRARSDQYACCTAHLAKVGETLDSCFRVRPQFRVVYHCSKTHTVVVGEPVSYS